MRGDDTTAQIKEKVDVVDFLKDYITLIPAGKNFKALCPFHNEKTPSFMVSPDRQTWHCFGACNTGGDIFTFLMRYENIEFFEALKILAEKSGIELRRLDPAIAKQFGVLYDIHVTAKNFFTGELSKSEEAQNYYLGRGLKAETISEFELGLSPSTKDALTVFLLRQGFHIDDILRSGLVVRPDRGSYFDRFRGRLMFPLYDHFGKIVGFTGRILPKHDDGSQAKYLNSPETPIFKKSKLFYGYHKSKDAIRENKTAFLVEGQMDYLLSFQDGVKNALATSGTSLTEEHLSFLGRQADKLIICFDKDDAGGNAVERAIDMAGVHEFAVNVVLLPGEAKDPAEYVVMNPGKLQALLKDAMPAMKFYFKRYLKNGFNKENVKIVLKKISFLASAIDRARELKALSELTGITELDLREEYDRVMESGNKKDDNKISDEEARTILPSEKDRRSLIAENILRYALINNDMNIAKETLGYFPGQYKEIATALISGKVSKEMQKTINILSFQPDFILAHNRDDLYREIKLEYLIDEKNKLAREIKGLDIEGKPSALEDAIKKFDLLSKEIHNLKN